jgi:glucuronoarabinoxylan endo-1,4-beta-xylanase
MLVAVIVLIAVLGSTPSTATVTIDASNTRQVIRGFGTCLISWGKFPSIYNDEMARVYVEELGLNMLRVNMAAWGYPEIPASEMTADKIDLANSDNRRVAVFLEFAKKLKALDPELKIIGTVWSPPAWMKRNQSITAKGQSSIQGNDYHANGQTNNYVEPARYDQFVSWMVAQAEYFRNEGVPFYALSPGNEVMFNQRFESNTWIARDFATIVARLGTALEQRHLGEIKIFGPETMTQHNWSIANPLYIKELHTNSLAWKYFDAFATHGYVDGFKDEHGTESSLEYWNLIRNTGKEYWMTEGGTGGHQWPEPLIGVAAAVHNSLVSGNANAVMPWQFTGAKESRHSLMVNRTMTKKTQVFRQFTKFIEDGAVRIEVPEDTGNLRVSAFHHAGDGQLTIVAINPSQQGQDLKVSLTGLRVKTFAAHRTSAKEDLALLPEVAVKDNTASIGIPAESIVTLVAIGVR